MYTLNNKIFLIYNRYCNLYSHFDLFSRALFWLLKDELTNLYSLSPSLNFLEAPRAPSLMSTSWTWPSFSRVWIMAAPSSRFLMIDQRTSQSTTALPVNQSTGKMYRNSTCLHTVIDKEKVKLVASTYRKNGFYT